MGKKTPPVYSFRTNGPLLAGAVVSFPAWIFVGLGLPANAQNLSGALATGTYSASGTLTNCSTVGPPPTGCVGVTLNSNASVTLLGGSQIILGPGFTANAPSGTSTSLVAAIGAPSAPPTPPPVTITSSTTLPNGNVHASYSFTFTASGGYAPYRYGLNNSNLPGGLELSPGGVLSGTPIGEQNYTGLGIYVVDSAGTYAYGSFNISILGLSPLSGVSCSASGSLQIGTPVTFTASAPSGSYTYSWSGSVAGSGSSSAISFTPSAGGNYVESVVVSSGSAQGSAQCEATVTAPTGSGPPITAVPSSLIIGPTAPASYTITVNPIAGFSGTVALSASGLPAGAYPVFNPPTLNGSGTTTLTITPTSTSPTGTFPIAIMAAASPYLFTANVILVVGQPSPANLISPPPGAVVSNGTVTLNWDAGVGATQYKLMVGSTPGADDIYSGSPTAERSATVSLSALPTAMYVTLSSLCGGAWSTNPPYTYPIGSPPATGTQAWAGSVPGYSTYNVPNSGSSVTLPFCLALSSGGSCDNTVLPALAQGLYFCNVTTNGQYPGIPAPGVTITSLNPYDPIAPAAFDVRLTATATPPGTYYVQCFFNNASPVSALWSIQVSDALPGISSFQEYPPNADGSFYVTLWGHNFGPDPGTITTVCNQNGCGSGSMNVCLSAACGNAYYVWSDQQINALMQPSAGAQDGTYSGTLCSHGEGGNASCLYVIFLFPFSEPSPAAAIYGYNNYFNNQNLTNRTQTVVVGQQIELIGVTNLPGAFQQAWSVSGGSYVGGYNVACTPNCEAPTASQSCLVDQNAVSSSNPNGCIPPGTPLIMTAQTLTIYFTQVPAGPVTVTYALYGQGYNPVAMATTTFNVVGPTGTGVSVFLLKGPAIAPGPPPLLQLGSSKPGIGFQGSATPPAGYTGNFGFVQIVSSASLVYGYPNGTFRTCGGSGLDTTYPYDEFPNPPQTASVYDTPSVALNSSTYTSQSDFNTFVMFLMWLPDLANSIPVPLGYVYWGWGGLASYISGSWVLTNAPEASYTVTQPTTTYPLWSQLNPIPLICGSPQ